MSQDKIYKGELRIKDRALLTVTGVRHITSFDAEYLTLVTDLGTLTVEGKELEIEALDKESGEIEIRGSVSGLFFNDRKQREGLFSRFFK